LNLSFDYINVRQLLVQSEFASGNIDSSGFVHPFTMAKIVIMVSSVLATMMFVGGCGSAGLTEIEDGQEETSNTMRGLKPEEKDFESKGQFVVSYFMDGSLTERDDNCVKQCEMQMQKIWETKRAMLCVKRHASGHSGHRALKTLCPVFCEEAEIYSIKQPEEKDFEQKGQFMVSYFPDRSLTEEDNVDKCGKECLDLIDKAGEQAPAPGSLRFMRSVCPVWCPGLHFPCGNKGSTR